MASGHSEAGRVVADRYVLSEELGRGGMGIVWRGWDNQLDREVAVKEVLFPKDMGEDEREEAHERVRRESRSAARLADHPNVITLHDVFDADGHPWVVMQLVQGQSLDGVLRDSGSLPPERVAEIATGVADALEEAHRNGVLHRDVKPGNVMLSDDGRVLLTDFGIAQIEGDTSITRTGTLAGSPEYVAPERFEGANVGPASDLWSLGVTLYNAVTGASPFRRETLPATIGAIISAPIPPPAGAGFLTAVIMGLLERDPERRLTAEGAKAMLAEPRPATGANSAFAAVPPRPPGGPTPPGGFVQPSAPSGGWAAQTAGTHQSAYPPNSGGYAPPGPTTPNPAYHAAPPVAPPASPAPPQQAAGPRPKRRRRLSPMVLGAIAAGVVLVLAAAAGIYALASRPATTEYAVWEDDRIQVTYPEDWEIDEEVENVSAEFRLPDASLGMTIRAAWYNQASDDITADLLEAEADIAEDVEGYERVSLRTTDDAPGFPADWEAAYWESTHTLTRQQRHDEGLDHNDRFRVAIQINDGDGDGYWIMWVGPASERENYRNIIQHTLDNFTVSSANSDV